MEGPAYDHTDLQLDLIVKTICEFILDIMLKYIPKIRETLLRKIRTRFKTQNNIKPIITNNIFSTSPKIEPSSMHQAENFMHQNPFQFNICHHARDNYYYKGKRAQCLSKLYEECLTLSPKYVPKIFRDTVHVRNEDEYNEIKNRDIEKLRSQIRILKSRETDFFDKARQQDSIIDEHIHSCDTRDNIKIAMKHVWNTKTKRITDKIDKKWKIFDFF